MKKQKAGKTGNSVERSSHAGKKNYVGVGKLMTVDKIINHSSYISTVSVSYWLCSHCIDKMTLEYAACS